MELLDCSLILFAIANLVWVSIIIGRREIL
jgi:hypothetical protein